MFNRLYVHVPFCINKCNYCAFVSSNPKENELSEYHTLLISELQQHSGTYQPIASIYFGGGTPSLLKPPHSAELIEVISGQFQVSPNAEITLEANPGTVDFASLEALRDAGFNRISLGIQSFNDTFLQSLGRIHSAHQSRQAFSDSRKAGFNNVSIDLIHSLPGQTLEQWRSELLCAIQLLPDHISIYGLTIEENTPFGLIYPSSLNLPDEDLSADMFELADELLTVSGFEHYEIANYAKPGYRSQHNSGYWKRDGYLGIGVAAHSFMREGYGVRYKNPDNLEEYRQLIAALKSVRLEENIMTLNDAISEYIYLGLRLSDGVNFSAFEHEFGLPLESVYFSAINELMDLGLLVNNGVSISLTRRGMLLSNQVFQRFII